MHKEGDITTVYGRYLKGILTVNGEEVNTVSYGILKDMYPDVTGVFNLKWSEDNNCWIIFQVFEMNLS